MQCPVLKISLSWIVLIQLLDQQHSDDDNNNNEDGAHHVNASVLPTERLTLLFDLLLEVFDLLVAILHVMLHAFSVGVSWVGRQFCLVLLTGQLDKVELD